MAAEDRLSKGETLGDIGAGIGGALLGAFLYPMMNRQPGVSVTQQIGRSLVANREQITGPILSRLSKKDEQLFASIELKLDGTHNGVPHKDILTQLLDAMGPWASDRFRSIAIGIPVPTGKKENKKTTKRDGTVEEVAVEESSGEKNPRVLFLIDTINDVIRFGKPGSDQTPPNFDAGIEQVLRNLKIRNIADADSMASKISRWWNDPHFAEYTQIAWAKLIQLYGWALPTVLGVNTIAEVTPALVAARFEEFIGPLPDITQPRPNDEAGSVMRMLRNATPGSFPNVAQERRPMNRRLVVGSIAAVVSVISIVVFVWVFTKIVPSETDRIINAYQPPAETPAIAPVK